MHLLSQLESPGLIGPLQWGLATPAALGVVAVRHWHSRPRPPRGFRVWWYTVSWISTSRAYLTPAPPGRPDAWTQSTGGRGSQRILGVGIVPASVAARAALRLPDGAAGVVRRARLILFDGEPIETVVSYWPAVWAARTALARAQPVRGGAVRLLADLGWHAAVAVEEVGADVADDRTVSQAPGGAALLVLRRTLLTDAGVPFEYCVMHAWDGRYQRYTVEVA